MPKKDRRAKRERRKQDIMNKQLFQNIPKEESEISNNIPEENENLIENTEASLVEEIDTQENNIKDTYNTEESTINEIKEDNSSEKIEPKKQKIRKSKKERGMTPEQIELKRTLSAVQTEKQHLTQQNKDLAELISSKTSEFAEREALIKEKEDNLEKKEKERKDIHSSKMKELEKDYQDKMTSLKKDYSDKTETLETSYKKKSEKLEEDFYTKSKNLDRYFKYLEEMKLEEFDKREKEVKEVEEKTLSKLEAKVQKTIKDLENKTEETDLEIKNKKELLQNYISEEEEKLEKKRRETEEYRDFITKKVDEQIEDKRQAFIDEMIYLDSDYREEMDRRNWEVSLREKAFEQKAKEKEAQILKSVNEYSENVDRFNKEVEEFNNDKVKFLNQHHWLHILCRKIKSNLYATIIGMIAVITLLFLVAYSNEYRMFKSDFIASAVNKFVKSSVNSADYEFELDTSNSVLTKFTTLNGLSIDINTMKNKTFSEDYDKIIFNTGENNYVYERYYKNKYMVLKSALFEQYVEFDNIENNGLSFREDEFNTNLFDVLKKSLAKSNNKYTSVAKINVKGTMSFLDFLNNSFFSVGNYEYFYTIENEDVDLAKNMLSSVLNSENYKDFIKEEDLIAANLKETNDLKDLESIVQGLINNTVSSKNVIDLKISEDKKLSDITITMNIEYRDGTMASSVPMKLTLRCNLEEINEDTTLRNPKFEINPVKFENMIKK